MDKRERIEKKSRCSRNRSTKQSLATKGKKVQVDGGPTKGKKLRIRGGGGGGSLVGIGFQ